MIKTLSPALTPRSIAVIGASSDARKIGGRLVDYLKRFGFQGGIYPVNPKEQRIAGLAAFAHIGEAPATDLAVLAIPAKSVVAELESCERAGVACAIVTASGIGPESTESILRIIERGRLRIIGPNAQGLANFSTGAVANFASLFASVTPEDGPVAIVSQSGSISTVLYCALREQGVGVRYSLAPGNELDISVADLVDAVVADSGIRLILIYLEGIARPDVLAEAAAKARQAGVKLVALKAGRTRTGQAAAQSHTGSLGSEDRIVDAFLEQNGIRRAASLEEMIANAPLYLQGARPKGNSLLVVTDSGASAVLAADAAEPAGLAIAELAPETETALTQTLPDYAVASNPLDLTSALTTRADMLDAILRDIEADKGIDLALFAFPSSPPSPDLARHAAAIRDYAERTRQPVAVAIPQRFNAAPFAALKLPVFADEERAVAALGQYLYHARLRVSEAPIDRMSVELALPESSTGFLDEAQSLDLIAAHGIPTVARRLCRTPADIANAFGELGPLVVIKACSANIPHKSEHRLVALNVETLASADEVATDLWRKLADLGFREVPLIMQRMEHRPHEFIIGGKVDPTFGTVVIVGAGGILAEQLSDVAVALAPFDADYIKRKLATLRGAPVWAGARGRATADLDAVARIACKAGTLLQSMAGKIQSLDLNPVLAGPSGQEPVVVDALVQLASGES